MNLTRKLFRVPIPRIALQSSGLVIFFAFVHTVSDAVTNTLSALLPTLQSRFGLTGTTLALLVATLSLSALVTQPFFGALALGVSYLTLLDAAALATSAIQPRKIDNETQMENITCLCSACIDQNIAAYRQRQSIIVEI